jgi:hypothetical protein
MSIRYFRIAAGRTFGWLSVLVLAIATGTTVVGCAPDAVRNYQATGFNGWLGQLPTTCQPLQIGSRDVGLWIQMNDMGNNDYNYFIDMTSRLYYNRISPASYRDAVTGQFGAGTSNDRVFACILRTLPAQRPDAPAPGYITY